MEEDIAAAPPMGPAALLFRRSWLLDRRRLELMLEVSSSSDVLSAPDPLRTPASAAPIDCAIPGGPPPLPPAEGVALEGRIRAPPSGVRGTADLSFLVEADVDLM